MSVPETNILIPQITVAIPTMRRYENFLKHFLPTYLGHPLVKHVLICDETGEDADAIERDFGSNPKMIVKRNPKRLGMYHNKRKCIEESPTEWVGVFDSDNFFPNEYFHNLAVLWLREGAKPDHFYASGTALFHNLKDNSASNPLEGFGGTKITKENWNDVFSKPRWNYMLNDGNYLLHKSVLPHMPADIPDNNIRATDSIFMCRSFVNAGFTFDIRNELSYIHHIHDGNGWNDEVDENMKIWNNTNWKF